MRKFLALWVLTLGVVLLVAAVAAAAVAAKVGFLVVFLWGLQYWGSVMWLPWWGQLLAWAASVAVYVATVGAIALAAACWLFWTVSRAID